MSRHLAFLWGVFIAVCTVIGTYFGLYPQPAQTASIPSWAIVLAAIGIFIMLISITPWILNIVRGQAFEFFPDRTSLQRAHGSLAQRLRTVKRASAIWVIGQKFYHAQEYTSTIKKLLLPNPNNSAFKFQINTGPNESAENLIRQITNQAKNAGAEVRWYDHFISHSIILSDTERRRGWVHIESVFPHSTTDRRPSYTIYKKREPEAVLEMQRVFDEMWERATEK